MKRENQDIIVAEVKRILPHLDYEGNVTIVIFVDHDIKTNPQEDEVSWRREQVFSYLCETIDDKIMVDDAVHTDTLINGETGESMVLTVKSLRP